MLLFFQEESSPLNNVRRRILILLGSLGGRCNLGLLGGTEGSLVASNGIAWDTRQHLSFAVPFQDMKPNIYLGKSPLFLSSDGGFSTGNFSYERDRPTYH